MGLRLVLGNKNYSSWSMRAWLLLRFVNAPFDEISISLYVPGSREKVMKLGGQTGLVPVLEADGYPVWDTLAITEYLFEQYPSIWPDERFVVHRSVCLAEFARCLRLLRTFPMARIVRSRMADHSLRASSGSNCRAARAAMAFSAASMAAWMRALSAS